MYTFARPLLLLSLLIASCECSFTHRGYVKDKETKKPVVNAKVSSYKVYKKRENYDYDTYTDSVGHYTAGYGITGSRFRQCPSIKIYIYKEGYKTYILGAPELTATDTIFLEKE